MIDRRELIGLGGALAAAAVLVPAGVAQAGEFEEILLWPGSPPGVRGGKGGPSGPEVTGTEGAALGALWNISIPRLRVYRPQTPNGRAVMVCGGGGYYRIQVGKESGPAARWLQARGYTVFELIYRLPNDGWDPSSPFADAQRAMKIIRTRAAEFGVQPNRIGVMGMSAGGHLAGFTALQPARALYAGHDAFEAASARPDFAALLFPVVTLRKPFDTTRTRRELIGRDPTRAAEDAWSLDTYAAKDAPPTIIFSAADDPTTPPAHGITLFQAMIAKGAAAELHIFEKGGHGWGLGTPDDLISQWPEIFAAWINRRTFD